MSNRITDRAPYGRHITLTCVNHPALEWSTKNIGSIGQRTVFFDLRGVCTDDECDCAARDLRVHPKYESMPVVPE